MCPTTAAASAVNQRSRASLPGDMEGKSGMALSMAMVRGAFEPGVRLVNTEVASEHHGTGLADYAAGVA